MKHDCTWLVEILWPCWLSINSVPSSPVALSSKLSSSTSPTQLNSISAIADFLLPFCHLWLILQPDLISPFLTPHRILLVSFTQLASPTFFPLFPPPQLQGSLIGCPLLRHALAQWLFLSYDLLYCVCPFIPFHFFPDPLAFLWFYLFAIQACFNLSHLCNGRAMTVPHFLCFCLLVCCRASLVFQVVPHVVWGLKYWFEGNGTGLNGWCGSRPMFVLSKYKTMFPTLLASGTAVPSSITLASLQSLNAYFAPCLGLFPVSLIDPFQSTPLQVSLQSLMTSS